MNADALSELLRALIKAPLELFWAGAAWLLDNLHGASPLAMAGGVVGALVAAGALALLLQRTLNRRLKQDPDRTHTPLQLAGLEARYAFVLLPLLPFRLLFLAIRGIWRLLVRIGRWLVRVVKREPAPEPPTPEESPDEPLLVATLGPSCLLAGLLTAGLYLLARLAEPVIAARLDLSEGLSAWQFLALGLQPELAWYLPLQRFPYFAALLATLIWLAVWSLLASTIRLIYHETVGRNLYRSAAGMGEAPEEVGTPELWRRWFATRSAHEPAHAYRHWARWPILVSAPLFAWAWLALGAEPYRILPSELAIAGVLWLSWGLHVGILRGLHKEPGSVDDVAAPEARRNGWEQVLADLEAVHQLVRPEPFDERPALALESAPGDRRTARILSPLVEELLERAVERDGTAGLTLMQDRILTTLALQGYVHSEPPVDPDHLELGPAETDVLEDRSGLRSRHQVVLAPEGTGKSTLALLAVTNHALVHTKTSLVVVSSLRRAQELHHRFRRALDPSTLRWNVRVRTPGKDLMTDLSRGILPDVLITDLHDLVVTLLETSESFDPFLVRLGLIIVDDVEAFSGPTEVHAQLAFRRLFRLVEERAGVRDMEQPEGAGPQLLALGVDGMHETSEWVQSLCGVDAVTRRFGNRDRNGRGAETGACHKRYRLRDFRSETGERLLIDELVAACERKEVPWHYRLCGDGRRNLGRSPLLLPDEPLHATPGAEDACVIFLEGCWSEVRREYQRLARAGTRFVELPGGPEKPEPVAFVTRVEPDVEMALTQMDERFVLSPTLDSLPRPVLRPPTGLAVHPHLSADLTQHWIEVEDVLRIFGDPTAGTLRRLAREGLLLAERRPDIDSKANRYVGRVYVQALARAVAPRGGNDDDQPVTVLPPKVSQVELVSPASVAVRDRTSLVTLTRIDTGAAHLVYYPGRIFKDARGTFVVVGWASEDASGTGGDGDGHATEAGDILVEPILSDSISAPRRRYEITVLGEAPDLQPAAGGAFFGPDRVLLGRDPMLLALRPMNVSAQHVGTYWLGPIHCEVRQRTLADSNQRAAHRDLRTVGLILSPNPEPMGEDHRNGPGTPPVSESPGASGSAEEQISPETPEIPRLTLRGARLLAAAMRAILPNLYRGAEDSIAVAVHLSQAPPTAGDDRQLLPDEGLVLFDLGDGGNGAARAVHRDGVDLLLRLCRLVIERVLSLHRLLSLHDHWGLEEEIEAEGRRERGGEQNLEEIARQRRKSDADLRCHVLDWLDSRLQPEGGAEAQEELARLFGSDYEKGKENVIDLGRCWYSQDGSVSDLLWVKHRWQRPGAGEAMLDIGFGRDTLASAQRMFEILFDRPADARWTKHLEAFGRYRDDLDKAYGRTNGRNNTHEQPVRFARPGKEPGESTVEAADDGNKSLQEIQLKAWAGLMEASPALEKLVDHLTDAFKRSPQAHRDGSPISFIDYLCHFVQGIPNAARRPESNEIPKLRPPVETLLRRIGDEGAKSLLLVALLARADQATGLFVSREEGRVLGAAPGVVATEDPPELWAEIESRVLLPIDTTRYHRPGRIGVREPQSWAFLPLLETPPRESTKPGKEDGTERSSDDAVDGGESDEG